LAIRVLPSDAAGLSLNACRASTARAPTSEATNSSWGCE